MDDDLASTSSTRSTLSDSRSLSCSEISRSLVSRPLPTSSSGVSSLHDRNDPRSPPQSPSMPPSTSTQPDSSNLLESDGDLLGLSREHEDSLHRSQRLREDLRAERERGFVLRNELQRLSRQDTDESLIEDVEIPGRVESLLAVSMKRSVEETNSLDTSALDFFQDLFSTDPDDDVEFDSSSLPLLRSHAQHLTLRLLQLQSSIVTAEETSRSASATLRARFRSTRSSLRKELSTLRTDASSVLTLKTLAKDLRQNLEHLRREEDRVHRYESEVSEMSDRRNELRGKMRESERDLGLVVEEKRRLKKEIRDARKKVLAIEEMEGEEDGEEVGGERDLRDLEDQVRRLERLVEEKRGRIAGGGGGGGGARRTSNSNSHQNQDQRAVHHQTRSISSLSLSSDSSSSSSSCSLISEPTIPTQPNASTDRKRSERSKVTQVRYGTTERRRKKRKKNGNGRGAGRGEHQLGSQESFPTLPKLRVVFGQL